ncbi:hypothetical protein OQA88_2240 [Cercophora sp. LCS_1]
MSSSPTTTTTNHTANQPSSMMQVYASAKRLFQDAVGLKRRKNIKRLQISQPFDFKKEAVIIPGLSEDEISVLREKAVASCIGTIDDHGSRSSSRAPSPDSANPCNPPPIPARRRSPRRSASLNTRLSLPLETIAITPLSALLPLPISPSSSGTSTPLDLDLGFQLGTPLSPLTPRGSPRSVRSKA